MSYNKSKDSFILFILVFVLSFILWYTNRLNDRIYSSFFFFFSLIYLVEYSIYSGSDKIYSGKVIIYLMILQVLTLPLFMFFFYKNTVYSEFLKAYLLITFVYCLACTILFNREGINVVIKSEKISYLINGKEDYLILWFAPVIISLLVLFVITLKLNSGTVSVFTAGFLALAIFIYMLYYLNFKEKSFFLVGVLLILIVYVIGYLE